MSRATQLIGMLEAELVRLRAELSALKAKSVMPDVNLAAKALCSRHAVICGVNEDDQWKEYGQDFIADAETVLANSNLYAAPVSETKAQSVVQWPDADEIMQMAFEEGQPADDASGYYFELEEFDLFIERLMSEVARLNAAPAAPAADACKACKGTGRRPIGGRGRIFGLTNRCFECQPLTDEEVYGQVTAHE